MMTRKCRWRVSIFYIYQLFTKTRYHLINYLTKHWSLKHLVLALHINITTFESFILLYKRDIDVNALTAIPHRVFTCLDSSTETLEHGVKSVQSYR